MTTAKLDDSAVTTVNLGDGAVIAAKLADAAVGTAKLADDAVVTSKIAAGAIGATEIADGAVSGGVGGAIADNSVTGADVERGVARRLCPSVTHDPSCARYRRRSLDCSGRDVTCDSGPTALLASGPKDVHAADATARCARDTV